MIPASIIELLRNHYRDASPEELADALWLASREVFEVRGKHPDRADSDSPVDGGPEDRFPPPGTSPDDDEDFDELEGSEESRTDDSSANLSIPDASQPQDLSGPIAGNRAGGLTVRAPGTHALPGARALARALRPFRRPVPSSTQVEIDERATATIVAETGIWLPVLRPARARHFEIALVIDESPSLIIWRDMIRELQQLLERNGGFRDVRCWWLDTSVHDSVMVRAQPGAAPRNTRELIAPDGKRLMLVVTDCLQPAWRSIGASRALTEWGRYQGVAVLQVLPQVLWNRTALNPERGVIYLHVGATAPAQPNALLTRQLWLAPAQEKVPDGVPIPILTTQPELFAEWSRLMDSAVEPRMPAVILPNEHQTLVAPGRTVDPLATKSPPFDRDAARALLNEFRAASSPLTYQLTQLLAAAPLRLPVMRLVQQVLLDKSGQIHLAEFFLSGLIVRLTPEEQTDPDWIDYDFLPHVRGLLLDRASERDALNVQRAVSKYIGERFGQVLDFEALLETPEKVEQIVSGTIDPVFARVSADVLRRLGGQYARAAERLLQPRRAPPAEELTEEANPFAGALILLASVRPKDHETHVDRLKKEGATVVIATSKEGALRHFTLSDAGPPASIGPPTVPNALITDIDWPGATGAGLELIDAIRRLDFPTPAVLLGERADEVLTQADDRDVAACSSDFNIALEPLRLALALDRRVKPAIPSLLPRRLQQDLELYLGTQGFRNSLARTNVTFTTATLLAELEADWTAFWEEQSGKQSPQESWNLCAKFIELGMGAGLAQIWGRDEGGRGATLSSIAYAPASDQRPVTLSSALARIAMEEKKLFQHVSSGNHWCSEVVIPLANEDTSQGAISAGSLFPHAFTSRQIMWLEMMARSALSLIVPSRPESAIRRIEMLLIRLMNDRNSLGLVRAALRVMMLSPSSQAASRRGLSESRLTAEFAELWATRPQPSLKAWDGFFQRWRDRQFQEFPLPASSLLPKSAADAIAAFVSDVARLGLGMSTPWESYTLHSQSLISDLRATQALPAALLPSIAVEMGSDLRASPEGGSSFNPSELMIRRGRLWPKAGPFPNFTRPNLARRNTAVWVSSDPAQSVSPELRVVAQRLGYVLAAAGFKLVCRNLTEVDQLVASSYVQRLAVWGFAPTGWLTQIALPSVPELESGGRVIEALDMPDSFQTALDNSDAVVMFLPHDDHRELPSENLQRHRNLFIIPNHLESLIDVVNRSRDGRVISESYRVDVLDDAEPSALVALSLLPDALRRKAERAPRRLDWPSPGTLTREQSPTLLRARGIVGFSGPDGEAATGVVLKNPHVIVTNSANIFDARELTVFDWKYQPHRAEVLYALPEQAHGLAILRVPSSLSAEGFDLSKRRLCGGATVQVVPLYAAPLGPAIKLRVPRSAGAPQRERAYHQARRIGAPAATLNAELPARASGAPVLDSSGRIVGMIVGDPTNPKSCACLDAAEWDSQMREEFSSAAYATKHRAVVQPDAAGARIDKAPRIQRARVDEGEILSAGAVRGRSRSARRYSCVGCGAPLAVARTTGDTPAYFRLLPGAQHSSTCPYGDPMHQLASIVLDAPAEIIGTAGGSPTLRLDAMHRIFRNYQQAASHPDGSTTGFARAEQALARCADVLQRLLRLRAIASGPEMEAFIPITYRGDPVAWDDFYFTRENYARAHQVIRSNRMPQAIEGRVLFVSTVKDGGEGLRSVMTLEPFYEHSPGDDSVVEAYLPQIWSDTPDAFKQFRKDRLVVAFGPWQGSTHDNIETLSPGSSNIRADRAHRLTLDMPPGQVCLALPENESEGKKE